MEWAEVPRAGRWFEEAGGNADDGLTTYKDVSTDRSRGRGAGHPITAPTNMSTLTTDLGHRFTSL